MMSFQYDFFGLQAAMLYNGIYYERFNTIKKVSSQSEQDCTVIYWISESRWG